MVNNAHNSDSLYHRFFSHAGMVVDLLMFFLDPALLAELDLDNLRRHNTKFTARQGQRRRSDVVCEIPTRQGGSLFVLLILEFQSEVDEWMVLRVDVYTGLIYQQLVDERKLKESDGLPPILPIILFNGESNWNVATSLRSLIRSQEGSYLWNLQPEMGYYVINEVAYPKEVLEGSPYLTPVIFRMEHPDNPEDMVRAAQDAVVWFEKHPDGPPVKQLFVELLLAGLTRLKVDPMPAIPEDLQEVVIMLAARVEKWAMDYEQKGRKDGLLAGEQIGEAKLLLRLLTRRFGNLSSWVNERVSVADLETLETWGDRVLDARSLDDVFDPNPVH